MEHSYRPLKWQNLIFMIYSLFLSSKADIGGYVHRKTERTTAPKNVSLAKNLNVEAFEVLFGIFTCFVICLYRIARDHGLITSKHKITGEKKC